MKRVPLLIASLALNLVLASVVAWLQTHRAADTAVLGPSPAVRPPVTSAVPPAAVVVATPGRDSDVAAWLPELRSAGVPEKLLAQLLAANFAAGWEKRRDELRKRWERGEIDDDEWAKFHRERDLEEETALRGALGDAAFKTWHEEKLLADLHLDRISLSAGERDALYGFRRELLSQQRELDRRHRAGEIDDAAIEQLQDKLEADYAAQAKTLLGDDRYATLQRPNDTLEGSLRRNLQSLNVSPTQSDAVIAAEQRWRDQRRTLDEAAAQESQLSPEAYQARLHALDEARDAELQRQLGAEGFDALRQLQDDRYRKLTKYAQLWQLTPTEVNTVYSALRDYGQIVAEYRRQAQSRGLSGESTQPAIDGFRQTTAASLRAALGETKYKQLTRSDVLDWDR